MRIPNIRQPAALDIESGGMFLERVALVVDDRARAMLDPLVVVEGGEARHMITEGRLANPPVKIDQVRMILLTRKQPRSFSSVRGRSRVRREAQPLHPTEWVPLGHYRRVQ